MRQKTFFDDEFESDMQLKRMARKSDPDTSHQAAVEIRRELRRLQLKTLNLIRHHPNHTARELTSICDWDAWKRIRELEHAGSIKCTGRRPCSVTGKTARTWAVVEGTDGKEH